MFRLVILPELDLALFVAHIELPVVSVISGTFLAGEAVVRGLAALLAKRIQ